MHGQNHINFKVIYLNKQMLVTTQVMYYSLMTPIVLRHRNTPYHKPTASTYK